jgi:hypothetical protein
MYCNPREIERMTSQLRAKEDRNYIFEDESGTERKLEGKRRCGGRLDKLGIGSCKASPAYHCSLYLIRTSADRAATAIHSSHCSI